MLSHFILFYFILQIFCIKNAVQCTSAQGRGGILNKSVVGQRDLLALW